MKYLCILLISIFFSSSVQAQSQLSASDIVLQLECNVSIEESKGNEGYKPWGKNSFNITVYSKNGKYFIKEQSGTYVPNWWGEGLRTIDISKTLMNSAGMNGETIWGSAATDLGVMRLEINRLNGSIRKNSEYKSTNYQPKTNYIETGDCRKVSNKF